ncbi:MarR family transcriptional regulator [Candidatus Gracilibacteria bacterium]|nr:MarR family transcriptional regulator [Candidatus Gracilibacteria bacterium]
MSLSPTLSFFISLSRIETVLSRKFDAKLGGLGFSDFLILYALSVAPDGRLRRIDLADTIGLTASGITRLLLPMEKVGLVRREAHDGDARVSYVLIAPGGAARLSEAIERAELYCSDIIDPAEVTEIERANTIIQKMSKRIG